MIEVPGELSPIKPETTPAPDALATGPFVVERVDGEDGSRVTSLGFDLLRADAQSVAWSGVDHDHEVRPGVEPALAGAEVWFTQPADGSTYVIRPLTLADASLAGEDLEVSDSLDEESARALFVALAQNIWDRRFADADLVEIGEDNLYLTRTESGDPLALVKMGAGFPTLLRQDNGWRPLRDDEDALLGVSDVPVREDAVTAWDSGELQRLEGLLMDERFSPNDVLALWAEVGDAEEIRRLLAERSRGRVYERTPEGVWADADPDPEAATIDLTWSAVGAWDTGELKKLTQAEEFDTNGEAA